MWRKQIIDVTGTPLTPSRQGRKCLGNGIPNMSVVVKSVIITYVVFHRKIGS